MREKHDEEERAALAYAVQNLKSSTSAVSKLPNAKLENMCQVVINGWLSGRSEVRIKESEIVVGGSLLREIPGRVPALEPYIKLTLNVLTQLDLPWDKPVNQWSKDEAVLLISAGVAQAMLYERHTLDSMPFPDNPRGKIL